MPKIMVKGQTVQAGELGKTDTHTNGWTLPSALSPCLVVDKYITEIKNTYIDF